MVRQAFRKYIIKQPQPNRSLLIASFGAWRQMKTETTVDYCAELLFRMPEETSDVVRYYESLGLSTNTNLEAKVTSALKSRELAMYDYQRFLLLSCYLENGHPPEVGHAQGDSKYRQERRMRRLRESRRLGATRKIG